MMATVPGVVTRNPWECARYGDFRIHTAVTNHNIFRAKCRSNRPIELADFGTIVVVMNGVDDLSRMSGDPAAC